VRRCVSRQTCVSVGGKIIARKHAAILRNHNGKSELACGRDRNLALSALDLRQGASGGIERVPHDQAVFIEVFIRTFAIAAVVTLATLILAFPVAYAIANAPIFSYDESFFGKATVGGPLLLAADTGRQTAAAAIRIVVHRANARTDTSAAQRGVRPMTYLVATDLPTAPAGERFRALLARSGILQMPGALDEKMDDVAPQPGVLRLVDHVGYDYSPQDRTSRITFRKTLAGLPGPEAR